MSTLLVIILFALSGASTYVAVNFFTRNESVFFYEWAENSDQFVGWVFVCAAVVFFISAVVKIIRMRSLKTKLHTRL